MRKTMRLLPRVLAFYLGLSVVLTSAATAYAQVPISIAAPGHASLPVPAQAASGLQVEASVVLGNIGDNGEILPLAADAVAAEATPSSERMAEPKVAETEPVKDPREVYRDSLLQLPEVMPASTSAASRRYRKVDLSAFRAQMQGK